MDPQEEFNNQLKTVFDLCDTEKCGYISVDQLAELAHQYFGGGEQDMVQVIRSLGPDNTGVVTFEEFCNGVRAILAMHKERADSISSQSSGQQSQHYDMLLPQTDDDSTARLVNSQTESPLIDTDNDSAIHSTSPVPGSDRSSVPPPLDPLQDGSSMSDAEEHYEYNGDLSDGDYDVAAHIPSKLDVSLRPSRAGNRNSSAVSAGQLLREVSQNNFTHSRQSSSCESGDDMFSGDLALEEDVIDLNEKVHYLQQQVTVLAEGQHSSNDKYTKVKQENSSLTSRILMLEEQLKEIELKSEERLKEEQKRTKEMMSKLEREKNLQIENYTMKLMSLEKEHFDLRDEVSRLRSMCDRLKEDKSSLQEQLTEKESEITILTEDHRKLQELSRREREEFCKERSSNTHLLNELTREIEELRKYREESEAAARARSPSFFEYPSRCKELEADLKSLKQTNQSLHNKNEELHATLLNKSFQDGCQLLNTGNDSSLADEFNECSKDQLMKALKDAQDENTKLRSYIDGMILNIMEHHPQILEVKGLFS